MKRLLIFLLAVVFIASCDKGTKAISSEIKDITPKSPYAMLIVESESCIYSKQLKKDLQKPEDVKELIHRFKPA